MAHKSILDLFEASEHVNNQNTNKSTVQFDRTPNSEGVGTGPKDNALHKPFKHIGMNADGTGWAVQKTSTLLRGRNGELGSHGEQSATVSSWTSDKRYNNQNTDIMRNFKK